MMTALTPIFVSVPLLAVYNNRGVVKLDENHSEIKASLQRIEKRFGTMDNTIKSHDTKMKNLETSLPILESRLTALESCTSCRKISTFERMLTRYFLTFQLLCIKLTTMQTFLAERKDKRTSSREDRSMTRKL